MSCIVDGRTNAAKYFRSLANEDVAKKDMYLQIANAFARCAEIAERMRSLFGNQDDMEGMLEKLADESVRDEVCILIDDAKKADIDALALMKK